MRVQARAYILNRLNIDVIFTHSVADCSRALALLNYAMVLIFSQCSERPEGCLYVRALTIFIIKSRDEKRYRLDWRCSARFDWLENATTQKNGGKCKTVYCTIIQVFFINRNILDSIKDFAPYLSNVNFIHSFLSILHFILVIDTIYPPNARERKRTKTAFIS